MKMFGLAAQEKFEPDTQQENEYSYLRTRDLFTPALKGQEEFFACPCRYTVFIVIIDKRKKLQ